MKTPYYSSENDSSDNDLEELIQKRKLPPEPHLPSFLINGTMFLGKECILRVSKVVNLHQWEAERQYISVTFKLRSQKLQMSAILSQFFSVRLPLRLPYEDFIKIDVPKSRFSG